MSTAKIPFRMRSRLTVLASGWWNFGWFKFSLYFDKLLAFQKEIKYLYNHTKSFKYVHLWKEQESSPGSWHMTMCAALLEPPNPGQSQGPEAWDRVWLGHDDRKRGHGPGDAPTLFSGSCSPDNLIILSIGTPCSHSTLQVLLRSVLPGDPHVISVRQRWAGKSLVWDLSHRWPWEKP